MSSLTSSLLKTSTSTLENDIAATTTTNEDLSNSRSSSLSSSTRSVSRGGALSTKNFISNGLYSSSVMVPIEKKSIFSLKISATETVVSKKKSYTVYVISIISDDTHWEVVRRYKHFRVFSSKIQNEIPTLSTFEFPSKKLIGNMNPNFIKHRKDQLQKFLTTIAETPQAKQSRNLKPTLRTIINPSREGYLYILRSPKKYAIGSGKRWKKSREQICAEAKGVVQLCNSSVKIIRKEDRSCIEINENSRGGDSGSSSPSNSNANSLDGMNSKETTSRNIYKMKKEKHYSAGDELSVVVEDLYYFSADTESILRQWLTTLEKESITRTKETIIPPPAPQSRPLNTSGHKALNSSGGAQKNFRPSSPNLQIISPSKGAAEPAKVIYNNQEWTIENSEDEEIDREFIDLIETTVSSSYKDLLSISQQRLNNNENGNGTTTTTTAASGALTSSSSSATVNITNPVNTTKQNSQMPMSVQKSILDKLKVHPSNEIVLLANENVIYHSDSIIHVHQNTGTIGSITITNYRFYFAAYYGSNKMAKKCEIEGIEIPLTMISKIVKCTGTTPDKIKYYAFELKCKDFHRIKFMHLPGASQHKANSRLYDILDSLIFKPDLSKLYCFFNDEIMGGEGWQIYNPILEYERMKLPNESWRISHFNSDFYHSPTYPPLLVVPKRINDVELISITSFRSKGRIPVLVWKSPNSNSVIVRCSQPVIGVTGKRCLEDEKLIESIGIANLNSEKVYIMDARPQINAVANQMMGLGYESTKGSSNYSNCILKFLGIENIHKMREAQKKLFKAAMTEKPTFDVKLEVATEMWLEHIRTILYGVVEIVDLIRFYKSSIVIHCSDGWDRTSQLSSLSMLLLDPYYRTIRGFQLLIEKEWLSFGHKFQQRIGHGSKNYKSIEYSPVFLQFIDCVWQIMNQSPNIFEFNTRLLMDIMYHLYSCRFGTFLFDCEMERVHASLPTKTVSLWSYLNQNINSYRNPNYHHMDDLSKINIDTSDLHLWKEYYLQWRDFHGL
eukprot:gene4941-6158_t